VYEHAMLYFIFFIVLYLFLMTGLIWQWIHIQGTLTVCTEQCDLCV